MSTTPRKYRFIGDVPPEMEPTMIVYHEQDEFPYTHWCDWDDHFCHWPEAQGKCELVEYAIFWPIEEVDA